MTHSNKRVVFTGGTGGLGRHVVDSLVREGAEVVVISRRRPTVVRHRVRYASADLSDPSGVAEAVAIAKREEPDLLINMAGTQYFGPAELQSLNDLQHSYMINLIAPVALCQACLPFMRRRNSGHFVNVGSIIGSIAMANFASYASAKAGLRAFSEALRREVAGTSVAVTYVAPRAVRTAVLSPKIKKYAGLTGMNIDAPEDVAREIMAAVGARKKEVFIGFPERLFVRLNAVLPGVVDAAVARGDRKARELFTEPAPSNTGGRS
jgi:short-subunit dehydrogenase